MQTQVFRIWWYKSTIKMCCLPNDFSSYNYNLNFIFTWCRAFAPCLLARFFFLVVEFSLVAAWNILWYPSYLLPNYPPAQHYSVHPIEELCRMQRCLSIRKCALLFFIMSKVHLPLQGMEKLHFISCTINFEAFFPCILVHHLCTADFCIRCVTCSLQILSLPGWSGFIDNFTGKRIHSFQVWNPFLA